MASPGRAEVTEGPPALGVAYIMAEAGYRDSGRHQQYWHLQRHFLRMHKPKTPRARQLARTEGATGASAGLSGDFAEKRRRFARRRLHATPAGRATPLGQWVRQNPHCTIGRDLCIAPIQTAASLWRSFPRRMLPAQVPWVTFSSAVQGGNPPWSSPRRLAGGQADLNEQSTNPLETIAVSSRRRPKRISTERQGGASPNPRTGCGSILSQGLRRTGRAPGRSRSVRCGSPARDRRLVWFPAQCSERGR